MYMTVALIILSRSISTTDIDNTIRIVAKENNGIRAAEYTEAQLIEVL